MTNAAKIGIAVVVVASLGGLGYLGVQRQGPKATEVRIEAVEARDLVSSVTASGKIQPRTKVDVSADVTGRIVRLVVKEGDIVTRGQLLLQIDPEQPAAALQRSEAALASAKAQEAQARANSIQAKRNYERLLQIKTATPTLVSVEQVEQAKTQSEVNDALHEAATFSVQQAQASVRDARQALNRTTILAPMSGKITRLLVEEGETAIMGTLNRDAATLLTIADMSVLETTVKVDETDVARVKVGDSAVVQIDAFSDTTFVGKVVEISLSSTAATTTAAANTDQAVDFEVKIELLNPPTETRPDFSATAKIVTDTRAKALSIPIIALTVREDSAIARGDSALPMGRTPTREVGKRDVEGVFVVGSDNKVSFRPVKVGIAGERHFEVLTGLQAGEQIVAGTYQAIRDLKDGALVRSATTPDAKPQS
ncbi:MAG TPA: efflux RND transporter periplasmic adaptor subunit [Gemmatimonadaceae bacterium]|nr:efflux RND transporter periplasmic adaptor subunit [Gemmatimonadaceae bacterium]